MKTMTRYEDRVLREIKEWEKAGPGVLIRSIDFLGTPIKLILKAVPESVRFAVGRAIMGFMEMLKDVSYWSFSNRSILREAKKHGIDARTIDDLAHHDIQKLDSLAREFFSSNRLIAALEGAGCGLGGFALIAADIPALLGIGFRSIQQIGICYGFDMRNPAMVPVVMGILNAGSGATVAVKSSILADMRIARDALLKGLTAPTKTGALLEALHHGAGTLPGALAENITKRKLGQLIPVMGAAIGAGFNYWFMGNVVVSAFMIFRKLHLERKYPEGMKRPSGRLALAFNTMRRGAAVD